MRLEHLPILLGVLVGAIGFGLIADAWLPERVLVPSERRRRRRAERDRRGEALVGVGTLCLAAALIGRDTWRYGTLAVLIGTVLLVAGGILNREYLREVLFFRGPARRAPEGKAPLSAVERERPIERNREDLADGEAGFPRDPDAESHPDDVTVRPPRPRIR